MTRLYFDTETTGIPNRYQPWNHPCQPRIVSIAWSNESGSLEYHSLIKPDGWEIDEAGPAFAAHKITNARCEAEGQPLPVVLRQFAEDLARTEQLCAYNIDFDIDMTRIECEKLTLPWLNLPPRLDILPLAQIACQMPPTDKMIAAAKRRGFSPGFKPPKLSEALRILCDEEFPEAHDALADVRATIKIHRKLEEMTNDLPR